MTFEVVRIGDSVIQDEELILDCLLHGGAWCGCRKRVVLENLDGPALWMAIKTKIQTKTDAALRNPFMATVNVPVITSVPFSIPVQLKFQEPKVFKDPSLVLGTRDAKVSLTFANHVPVLSFLKSKGIRPLLGTLHYGEGREVLRSMVRNTLDPIFEFDIKSCKSPHHGVDAENEWKSAQNSVVDIFMRNWSLIHNAGICNACFRRKIELAEALGLDHRTMV